MNPRDTKIWARAMELVRLVEEVSCLAGAARPDLIDQLRRASSSVIMNFAEGCGRTTRRDRARFFAMARASASECGAGFAILEVVGLIDGETVGRAADATDHLGAMLYRWR